MHSALYDGTVAHARFTERTHAFSHRVVMAYLDLDEVGDLLGGRLVRPAPGVVRFRRRDYLGDPDIPLNAAVRNLVGDRIGLTPTGPIRLLTQLRSFGTCFNPVSFYYCFEAGSERLRAIVAEVTNTPWGERHAYVLACPGDGGTARSHHGVVDKVLHVSPFLTMEHRYEWWATVPGSALSVRFDAVEGDTPTLTARLALTRRPLTRRSLRFATVSSPAASARILALIYGHAVVLTAKGVSRKPHPEVYRS